MNDAEKQVNFANHADSLPPHGDRSSKEDLWQNADQPNDSELSVRKRKYRIPTILFLLTCLSTFWVGVTGWQPIEVLVDSAEAGNLMNVRLLVLANWQQGLLYMASLLGILLFHELGHFFTTIIYRIHATAPIFLPFPISNFGTLGAVIAMDGTAANRRQIFDIGIAGPLAGLVVAIPMALLGASNLDLTTPSYGAIGLKMPLLLDWLIRWNDVAGYKNETVYLTQLNPYFAAAWMGFVITGLNMMPVGQLDGGHITYTLFGKYAHPLAKLIVIAAIAFMVYFQHYVFILMVALLILFGTEHPPTSDDTVKLGWFRTILGLTSLAIPIFCFPPMVFALTT
jgi:hypothetical protein